MEGDVSEDDLISSMGRHIRNADLNLEQMGEVVRQIESLEGCMKEYSKVLKDWAFDLKQDLETARNVQTKLFTRKQKLELLQSSLENKRENIKAEFSCVSVMPDLHKELLETEDKLRYVKEEIKACVKELERANADYWVISDKLNICQTKLQACVKKYQKLLETLKSVYDFKRQLIASSLNPIRAALGLKPRFHPAPEIYPFGFRRKCKQLIDSCVEELKELEDNKREIQAIQDELNEARHPHSSTMNVQ